MSVDIEVSASCCWTTQLEQWILAARRKLQQKNSCWSSLVPRVVNEKASELGMAIAEQIAPHYRLEWWPGTWYLAVISPNGKVLAMLDWSKVQPIFQRALAEPVCDEPAIHPTNVAITAKVLGSMFPNPHDLR